LFVPGCVILYRELNLVIIEGGPKAVKKYKQLMLHRIKWAEEKKKKQVDEDGERKINTCVLVWEVGYKLHVATRRLPLTTVIPSLIPGLGITL
jgi:hypothetical protein